MQRIHLIYGSIAAGFVLMIVGAFMSHEAVQRFGYAVLIAGVVWYFTERRKEEKAKKEAQARATDSVETPSEGTGE